jgi:asparagine synthase (glutamine-hydrolysing)
MCGIAGIIDLAGQQPVPPGVIEAMAQSLLHRGPDEDGYLQSPGLALASRRLSIVGLADGRQPIFNEDGSVAVVYNGELFDYPERRAELEAKGHRFATHCDIEILPHLWEEHGEDTFAQLRGQFALALWDGRQQKLFLARDRFGICPVHWARVTGGGRDWLLFASEIRALFASGLVRPEPDVRGLDSVFNFFAVPAPATCFRGVQALIPGHSLAVQPTRPGHPAHVRERTFWEMDFPDRGLEERGPDGQRVIGEFEGVLFQAVQRRLRADVPVVSYLSGGVDSSTVVAMACKALGRPIPAFTVRVLGRGFDETGAAAVVTRHLGAEPVVVDCGDVDVADTYPRLIRAAEAPVLDASCTGLLLLAREVHRRGYKVALTGEGADEWLAGYPWDKIYRLLGLLDGVPGLSLGQLVRRTALSVLGAGPRDWDDCRRAQAALGGPSAIHELYALMGLSRRRFYSRAMWDALDGYSAYDGLGPAPARFSRWHPLNRSVYWVGRIHLPGHLLSFKGDRIAMHSSVETRYPFLDEDVFAFLARLHPRWKLHGLGDKHILRLTAERWLPRSAAWRSKQMFRAPSDFFCSRRTPAFVGQLLSEESLRKTGYFDPKGVHSWWRLLRSAPRGSLMRVPADMGLTGVLATQLWHHTFLDSSLADLPSPVSAGAGGCSHA